MPNIQSYSDADAFLHTRGKRVAHKKVANNTYAHRRTDDRIAIRLHNTDVVTYDQDGLITLNTGGWLTVTTKARINDHLPSGWHLVSVKGTWHLANGWREASQSFRFRDGIQMRRVNTAWNDSVWSVVESTVCPESQAERDDRHNAAMRKLIGTYVRSYGTTLEVDYSESPHPDACTLCRVARTEPHPTAGTERPRWITYGDDMDDTQHLTDHMLDGTLPHTLVLAALAEKGYIPHHGHATDTVKRCLRAYLSSRLFVGATAPVHGRRPITSGV